MQLRVWNNYLHSFFMPKRDIFAGSSDARMQVCNGMYGEYKCGG
jgi:hypothetical protein